jgi:NAD(P)-dependent dehydrogenase (short-subunit alcohol dehydrogenase family)
MSDLAGRTAVVTGAARGIGAACAQALEDAGAHVVGVDLRTPESTPSAFYSFDLARTHELTSLVDRIVADVGPIHILVNNAGVSSQHHFNQLDPATWRTTMAVNVDAPFFLAQRTAEHLIAAGLEGRVINISSKNGRVAEAGLAHYNTSKGAIEMLTRSLAVELAPHGITCNAVAPGMISTSMGEDFDADMERLAAAWTKRIPSRVGWGVPADVANAVVFLASDKARYITGTTLTVDGGVMADQMPRLEFMPPYRNSIQ